MKKAIALFLALALSLSLAACGGAASSAAGSASNAASKTESTGETKKLSATLEYWSSWSETENQAKVLQEAADAFKKENPGVKINFTFNGRDNRTLVGSAIEAGTTITMMDANADNIQSLWANYVEDLTPYFGKTYPTTDGKAYVDTLMPAMAGLSKDLFAGKYGYFPYTPQAFMIFCNKTILEKSGVTAYPSTWDELMAACQKIKDAGYTPITTDANYCTSWMGYYLSRLMGADEVAKLNKDPAAWSDPRVLEAAKAVEEMASKGYFDANIESNVYPNAQQDMVISGKVAMYINGTWLPNEVSSTTPADFKWGAFAFPEVKGGKDNQTAGCYSSYGIAVNKKASDAEKEAAVAFAVYVTTKFDQNFATEANAIPVSLKGTWPDNLADARTVIMKYTTRYPSQTALILNSNSKQIIADACLKLMGGSIKAEDFVKQAAKF